MEKNQISALFEDFALYEKKDFKLFTKIDDTYSCVKDEDLSKILTFLGLLQHEKLITDCLMCEGHFPFSVTIKGESFSDGSYIDSLYLGEANLSNRYSSVYIDFSNPKSIEGWKIRNSTISFNVLYLNYFFTCQNNSRHVYSMRFIISV